MGQGQIKYGAQLAAKIEPEVMAKFIANAEACKSTKDIVLRELVYAFNRYCAANGGRFPALQSIDVIAPGYTLKGGRVHDATNVMTGTELGMDPIVPVKSRAAKPRSTAPQKLERPQAS
jgi:hypothetical protein